MGMIGLAEPITIQPAASLDASERLRLMRDGIINNASVLLSGIIGILLVPLMLKGLGAESYGLWVVATTMAGMLAVLDFGLYWSVTREVSSDLPGETQEDTRRFVETAGNAYALIGLAGALFLGTLGFLMSGILHLEPETEALARVVFALVGTAFFSDQLTAFSSAVFAGLRRFDYSNLIAVGVAMLRAGGIVALLAGRASLVSLAIWYAAASAIGALVALFLITRIAPQFRFEVFRLRWNSLRQHFSFGMSSLLTAAVGGVTWHSGSLLIGLVRGSASVVPFHIGQKFPLAVSGMNWRVAEVLFPAASESEHNLPRTREILEVGTRWVLVLALPLAALLWVVAPNLLRVWLGGTNPEAVFVLRLMSATVLADALMVGPLHILWGRGAVRKVLFVLLAVAGATTCLSLGLVIRIGAVGAAWGMLLPMVAGAGVLLHLACQTCEMTATRLAKSVLRGLLVPTAGCVSSAYLILRFSRPSLGSLIGAGVSGGLIYALSLYFVSGRPEEKKLVQNALQQAVSLGRFAYRAVRGVLRRIGLLRSIWHFLLVLRDMVQDPWRDPAIFEQHFERKDPWEYDTPTGRKRLLLAREILQSATDGKRFRWALEVGCAEGAFTDLLAEQCESLLAVDFAPTALERARKRCSNSPHVRFGRWDLRRDPLPGMFDLIVVMDVLDTIFRPAALKAAREKLINSLHPGGYLLVGDVRQSEIFEKAWWGRRLSRGGKWVNAFVASDPALRVVATASTESHVFTLMRKES